MLLTQRSRRRSNCCCSPALLSKFTAPVVASSKNQSRRHGYVPQASPSHEQRALCVVRASLFLCVPRSRARSRSQHSIQLLACLPFDTVSLAGAHSVRLPPHAGIRAARTAVRACQPEGKCAHAGRVAGWVGGGGWGYPAVLSLAGRGRTLWLRSGCLQSRLTARETATPPLLHDVQHAHMPGRCHALAQILVRILLFVFRAACTRFPRAGTCGGESSRCSWPMPLTWSRAHCVARSSSWPPRSRDP